MRVWRAGRRSGGQKLGVEQHGGSRAAGIRESVSREGRDGDPAQGTGRSPVGDPAGGTVIRRSGEGDTLRDVRESVR